jgi:PTS system nitrogen regulatory IIA component
MGFEDLIAPGAVLAAHPAASKRAAFAALAAHAGQALGVHPDCVAESLWARERLGTTGFGAGVAIPHGRLHAARGITGAVVRLAAPLDYGAIDGQPVDLLFMLVSPEAGSAAHLKALARVSRALRDAAFVAKLRGAPDSASLHALLCAQSTPLAA